MNPETDLKEQIAEAFGNSEDCLGALFVKNVPDLLEMRRALLKSASKVAHLPKQELLDLEHPESFYYFGWSHAKEIMNGKADTAKGSYYNNPVYEIPPGMTSELQQANPSYYNQNIWPTSLPELKLQFKTVPINLL